MLFAISAKGISLVVYGDLIRAKQQIPIKKVKIKAVKTEALKHCPLVSFSEDLTITNEDKKQFSKTYKNGRSKIPNLKFAE